MLFTLLLPLMAAQAQDAPAEPERIAFAKLALKTPVVATLSTSGQLSLLHAASGKALSDAPTDLAFEGVRAMAISPDGEQLAMIDSEARLRIVGWRSPDEALVIELDKAEALAGGGKRFRADLSYSPNGTRLLAYTNRNGMQLLSGNGEPLGAALRPGGMWFDLPWAWSGDGKRWAAVSNEDVLLMDAEDGSPVEGAAFDVAGLSPRCVDLDSSGERVVVGGYGYTAVLFDGAGEELWRSVAKFPNDPFLDMNAEKGAVANIAFSPDNELLAVTVAKGTAAAVFASKTGEQIAEGLFCGGRMGEPRSIAWSAGSRRLYHGFISGAMALKTMEIEGADGTYKGLPETPFFTTSERGLTPVRGWKDHGLMSTTTHLRLIEMASGKLIWSIEQ